MQPGNIRVDGNLARLAAPVHDLVLGVHEDDVGQVGACGGVVDLGVGDENDDVPGETRCAAAPLTQISPAPRSPGMT